MENKDEDMRKKYKEHGFRNFSILGALKSKGSGMSTLNSDFSKEDVERWFKNPDTYSTELRNLSRYLYISKGIYYTTINFYTNLLKLDYVLVPKFVDFKDKDKDNILNSKQKTTNYCGDILQKPTIRNIIKASLKDGCYFGYERGGRSSFYIQRLPNDFCREGAWVDGLPSIEFDFSFFDKDEYKLESYDKEFTQKYKIYKRDKNKKWQQLDYLKCICIPLESEDFNFPALAGIFDDLIDLDDYYRYMKQAIELDVSRILIQTPPMNEETGEMLVEPEDIRFFQNAIANVLDERFKIVSTPFDVDSIDFSKNKSGDAGLSGVDKMKSTIWNGMGISKSIFGETDGATGQKISHEVNVAYVFSIVEKIEMWVNRRLKRIGTKKYGFKVKFLPTSNVNKKESFEMWNQLLALGGSLNMAISSAGMNPDDYIRVLQLENLEGVKDHLTLPQSIYTQTGNGDSPGGAPPKDDLTDGGDKTRDTDGNDR